MMLKGYMSGEQGKFRTVPEHFETIGGMPFYLLAFPSGEVIRFVENGRRDPGFARYHGAKPLPQLYQAGFIIIQADAVTIDKTHTLTECVNRQSSKALIPVSCTTISSEAKSSSIMLLTVSATRLRSSLR